MKFRLATIAYVFALLAAGMAAFGGWGIVVAAWVLLTWVFLLGPSRQSKETWLVISLAAGLLLGLFLPVSMGSFRGPAPRNQCLNNMKQIMLGLLNYEAAHGTYPPPFIADANGKPMHSWRVLILPYIEHPTLFKSYRMDEPWDGPNNRKLWDRMPEFYRCPGCDACERLGMKPFGEMPANAANYFAVVGENAGWSTETTRTHQDLNANGASTLLVMEHTGKREPWTAPVDLSVEEAVAALSRRDVPGHLHASSTWARTSVTQRGRTAGTSMGYGTFLPSGLSEETSRSLLAVGGARLDEFDGIEESATTLMLRWRYDRIYGVGAFVVLALWPSAGRWRRAKKPPV